MTATLRVRRALRTIPGWEGAMRRRWAIRRRLADRRARISFALQRSPFELSVPVAEFTSPVALDDVGELGQRVDPGELHQGKLRNLEIAVRALDGVLIAPGQVLSFWRLVGAPSLRRGFANGPSLRAGALDADAGGGLCAASSMVHWLALNSELEVLETAEHSLDPFPDAGRTVPWGTGSAVSWPRLDLRLRNPGPVTFQVRARLAEGRLIGRLLADREPERAFIVHEREPAFFMRGGRPFRRNEIWRTVLDARDGRALGAELLYRNEVETVYQPDELGPVVPIAVPQRLIPAPKHGGERLVSDGKP